MYISYPRLGQQLSTQCKSLLPVASSARFTKRYQSSTTTEASTEERLFSRLDICVGKIVDIRRHEEADSLYIEQIDCGEGRLRTIVSGLVPFFSESRLSQQKVIVLMNLKPSKLRGVTSEGMLLCASSKRSNAKASTNAPDSETTVSTVSVELLQPPSDAQPGDRITYAERPPNLADTPPPTIKIKTFQEAAKLFSISTDGSHRALFNGKPWRVAGRDGDISCQSIAGGTIS
ncbi:hypothetical protein BZG36_04678 [Bifiguratus adelaidae]|uniref:tRNA-binding domain-containing protein n=1 Tax=Bifiguratus adelaidae TaxID=1938954 RepID=A0A261XXP5_9FUNG|nr:hypothetical protein BZG36_04678 [Bifiguratus adelaidae]